MPGLLGTGRGGRSTGLAAAPMEAHRYGCRSGATATRACGMGSVEPWRAQSRVCAERIPVSAGETPSCPSPVAVAGYWFKMGKGRGEGAYGREDAGDTLRYVSSRSPAHGREAVGVFFCAGERKHYGIIVCSSL